MPPLRGSDFSEHMAEAARKLGWKPFRAPAAINSQPYQGRPGCAYHGYCATGGCHISAKNSTAVTTIPEAQKTKNLQIFDYAQVTRIVSGANGRVTGVTYIRRSKRIFPTGESRPARVLHLRKFPAAAALEVQSVSQRSRQQSRPGGQALFRPLGHRRSASTALFPFDINVWYGLPAQGATVDEWADDNYDHSGLGFIGGTSLHAHTELHPIDAAGMATFGRAPGWGSAWKRFVRQNAARFTSAYLQTSTFPYEATFLDLDDNVRDPLGDPVCRVTTSREGKRNALRRLRAEKDGGMVPRGWRDRSHPPTAVRPRI